MQFCLFLQVDTPDPEKSQGDVIGNLLSRVSRLGSMLEVDLDADDYMAQPTQSEAAPCRGNDSCQSSDPIAIPTMPADPLESTLPTETDSPQQQLSERISSPVPCSTAETGSEAPLFTNRFMTNRVVCSLHSTDSLTSVNSAVEFSVIPATPTTDRDCFDTPVEVCSAFNVRSIELHVVLFSGLFWEDLLHYIPFRLF